MSLIRTTKQAQGVQRCSTRLCMCCDKQGRCWLFGEILMQNWATLSDGSAMSCSEVRLHRAPVCAKHQNAKGVFIHRRDAVQQVTRVVIN